MLIDELPWTDVEKLFKKGVAIVPIGATEQHGPHLPLGVDTFYAHEYAKRVGEKLKIPVCPSVPYSISGYNFPYPTITIEPETMINYLKDICRSLKFFGVTKVFFFVGHGGENASVMDTAEYIIARDLDIQLKSIYPWTFLPKKEYESMDQDWHAGRIETAEMLCLKENLVQKSKIQKSDVPKPMEFSQSYRLQKKDSRQGVFGDPSQATKEQGEQNIGFAVAGIVKKLKPLI